MASNDAAEALRFDSRHDPPVVGALNKLIKS
jgi:hypothetical protein